MRRKSLVVFLILFVSVFTVDRSFGKTDESPKGSKENPLIVAVSVFAPMVMKNKTGELYGHDIDLWKEIAREREWHYVFKEVSFQGIFPELENKRADIAISGITITDERERIVDFTHHYYDSGLRIMVREHTDTNIFSALQQIWSNKQNRKIVTTFFIFLIFSGYLYWLLERKNQQIAQDLPPGLLDGVYWSTVTSATLGYGDITPKTKKGKILTILIIFIGIAFFNYFQAQLSSMFVMQKFESNISSKQNLNGKLIATEAGTTSVQSLKKLGANVYELEDIRDGYRLLEQGNIDAVVFDAPALTHYISNEGAGKFMLVGELFDKQYYGIALCQGSDLREQINIALLKFRENGVYGKIYRRWLENVSQ